MREIKVSTEVFSMIWANRREGEESENDILLRVLSGKSPPSDSIQSKPDEKQEKAAMVTSSAIKHAYWWQVVEAALEQLGRPSSLSEIYRNVVAISAESGRRLPAEIEATVRGTLEDNSSDSDRYKGVRDIFCQPEGKHTGVWALRRWFTQNKK